MGNATSATLGPSVGFLDGGSILSGGIRSRNRHSRRYRRNSGLQRPVPGSGSVQRNANPNNTNGIGGRSMVERHADGSSSAAGLRQAAAGGPPRPAQARAAAPGVAATGAGSAGSVRNQAPAQRSSNAHPPSLSTSALFGDRQNDPGHIHTPLATREKRLMRSLHPHLFGEPSPVATQTKVKVGNGEASKFSQELNIISACVKDMEQSISCPICLEAFKR